MRVLLKLLKMLNANRDEEKGQDLYLLCWTFTGLSGCNRGRNDRASRLSMSRDIHSSESGQEELRKYGK